jgi:opacity protein-like surface antigen
MKVAMVLLLIALSGSCANAQSGNFIISYPISFPMGNLHSYTTNTSFRGISLEFNKRTSPITTAGLELGWNVFYQHVEQKVYQEGTASISGVQYRYTNAAPIVAGVDYHFETSNHALHPFAGIGLGTTYVERSTDFGVYRLISDAWQFCIRPELGLDVHFAHGQSLFLAAKYFWNFNTSDLDGQSWLSLNVGVRLTH